MRALPALYGSYAHELADVLKRRCKLLSFFTINSSICGEFSTKPNLTKICTLVWVADVINRTKFGNDRSREYKVTEGRILACSIGMACRL